MNDEMTVEQKVEARAIANYALKAGIQDKVRAAKSFGAAGKIVQDLYKAEAQLQLISEIGI